MRIFLTVTIMLGFVITGINAQGLQSARDVLAGLSDRFKSNVRDYQASIKLTQGENSQSGTVRFRNPQKMRVDFSDGQILCSDGYELWIYIPAQTLLLKQELQSRSLATNSDGTPAAAESPMMTTLVGLDRLIEEYSVEFPGSRNAEVYKDGTNVYQFKLTKWQTPRSGISVINLTVQDNGMIRRVEGFTTTFRRILIEFDDIQLNTGISNIIFTFESPGLVNTINNFMTLGE